MGLNETETRTQLIDPAIHARGWNEDLIKREETLGTIEIVDGQPRRQTHGRTDYTLRVKVGPEAQPVAVAILEAKDEDKHPAYGLDQVKVYQAKAKRLNLRHVAQHVEVWWGEQDHFTSRVHAESLAAMLPYARLTLYPNDGHNAPIVHWAEMLAALA